MGGRTMSDKRSKLAILASLLWVVMATFTILTTHQGALAQQFTPDGAPAVESLLPTGKSC